MKGDYSRDTFDPAKHFTRVLMQQGRVQLDADWNEQTAIIMHYLHSLARDLIGPYGVPYNAKAFMISPILDKTNTTISDLSFGAGRYYVDGILCETKVSEGWEPPVVGGTGKDRTYYNQPDYPLDETIADDKLPDVPFLVYLDVWERHITTLEDPHIQEVALGGPDTAARTKIIWQIKVKAWKDLDIPFEASRVTCENGRLVSFVMAYLREQLKPSPWELMSARAQVPEDSDAKNVCIVSPEARYRGAENQLYRVEIHRKGKIGDKNNGATFKWSRENGSVVFPIRSVDKATVSVDDLGRDARFGLQVGDWVELVDDATVLRGEAWPLRQVKAIDSIERLVTLSDAPVQEVGNDQSRHPLLRRWDHQQGDPKTGGLELASDGAALVVESEDDWLNLEDGVQIQFPWLQSYYSTGDYWLVPARTATGNVDWPLRDGKPRQLLPRGIEHHYAPLAIVFAKAGGGFAVTDLRHFILPSASCCPVVEVGNQETANVGDVVEFAAVVGYHFDPPGLTYNWNVKGGTIGGPMGASIKVKVDDPNASEVLATVTITGLPADCPKTAKGVCLIIPKK